MAKRKKRAILVLLLLAGCAGLIYITQVVTYGPGISKTTDGWECSGEIMRSLSAPNKPLVTGPNVLFVEKDTSRLELLREGIRGALRRKAPGFRDTYEVSAVGIPDGKVVYSITLKEKGRLLNFHSLRAWRGGVLLFGYDEKKAGAGLAGRDYLYILLDSSGKEVGRFPIKRGIWPVAVDSKDNLLLCREGSPGYFPSKFTLVAIDLPSGAVRFRKQLDNLSRGAVDEEGNLYALLKTEEWNNYDHSDRTAGCSAEIVKYSVDPWKKLWSVRVKPQVGIPHYLQYRDGKIWLGINDPRRTAMYPEDRVTWGTIVLAARTGREIKTQEKYDPYRFETVIEGKRYIITTKGRISVKTVPSKKATGH